MHELLGLWLCEMEKTMLNWPVVNFLAFLYLCFIMGGVAVAESVAALDATARKGCVLADQMAH